MVLSNMTDKRKIANRNKARGKKYQTTVADMTGGKNIGSLGGEDVMHNQYSIEAKTRKKFVAENWMLQAEANNDDNKVCVVFVHINGKRHENDLVLMRYKDWINISPPDKGKVKV